jgi:hypothetical protein
VLYAIMNHDAGAVKIGFSANPEARLKTLQTGSPHPLELLGKWPGGESDEAAVHDALAPHRLEGEWFQDSPEVMHVVRRLIGGEALADVVGEPEPLPLPIPRLVAFFRKQDALFPELCASLSTAVGFLATVYRSTTLGGRLGRPLYQVMPWHDDLPPDVDDFWWGYLDRKQWHDTPNDAATIFARAWREWQRRVAA